MKISFKILLLSVGLVGLLCLVGIFSLVQLGSVNAGMAEMGRNWLPAVSNLLRMQTSLVEYRLNELEVANAQNPAELESAARALDAVTEKLAKYENGYQPTITLEEEKVLYAAYTSAWGKYKENAAKVVRLAREGKVEEARTQAHGEASRLFDLAAKALEEDVAWNQRHADDEVKKSEATYASSKFMMIVLMLLSAVAGLGAAFFLGGGIGRRLGATVEVLEAVAGGDMGRRLHDNGTDEIGKMGVALNQTLEDIAQKVNSILGVVKQAEKGDLTQQIDVTGSDPLGQMGEGLGHFMETLNRSIGEIGANSLQLASAAEESGAASHQISANAEETSTQARAVSSASEGVNRSVHTVAASAEEMGASIKEIARSAAEASQIASSAVSVLETTNARVAHLGQSSQEIGQVLKLITTIAQQTNLLALNATIEAARAGEAGRGFAVVANEVKELAKETAKATEDITHRIDAIQTDAKGAVAAMGEIDAVIKQIHSIQTSIASAVEEQTATTNEITRSVQEAAQGISAITQNIAGVADAAQSTSQGTQSLRQAAEGLAQMSEQLKQLVGQFRVSGGSHAQQASSFRKTAKTAARR